MYPTPGAQPLGQMRRGRRLNIPMIVALCVAASGFVISVESSSTRTRNGVVVEHSSTEYAGYVIGPAAILAGVIAIVLTLTWRDRSSRPALEIGLSALAIAVGGLHLLGAG